MYVILLKNPANDKVCAIMDGDDIATFVDEFEAFAWAEEHPLCKAWSHQLVEVEL